MHSRGSTRPRPRSKDQTSVTSPRRLPDSLSVNRAYFATPTSSSSSPMRTSGDGRSVRPRLPLSLGSPTSPSSSSSSSSSSRKPSSPNGQSKESPNGKLATSLVLHKNVSSLRSPTDKSSLPAFYCEPVVETERITSENPKSFLDNLKADIANVLKKISDDDGYHYPVGLVESSGQPLEFLKTSRNINNVKELNNLLEEVRSENFKLKLKLFYHEEKNKTGNSVENNQHVNLKVELEQTKLELVKRNELLKETLLFLNSLGKEHEKIHSERLSEVSLKTSEDDSLTSQLNCWTTSEDSIAFHVRDKDCLKNIFNKLMEEAKSVAPNLKTDIEYVSNYFTHAINRASGCGEDGNYVLQMDGDVMKMSQRITELEAELKKFRDEAAIPTRDTPSRHETEQELRLLHQAYSEKDRLYQDAIKEKFLFMKETEDHYKSVIAVAKERSDEVNRLNDVIEKMKIDIKNMKHADIEDKSMIIKLQEELKVAKASLEQEIENNTRIVSEAEVLDRIQNDQSEELSELKNKLLDLEDLQQRQLLDLQEKDSIISKLEVKLKETTNTLQHLKSQIIIMEDKSLTEKEALQKEIEELKRDIETESQLNKPNSLNVNVNNISGDHPVPFSSSKVSLSFTKNNTANQRKSDGDLRCKEAELIELRQLYKEAANQISILEKQLSEKTLQLDGVKKQNQPKHSYLNPHLSGSYIEMDVLSSEKLNENSSVSSVLKTKHSSSENVIREIFRPEKYSQFGQTTDVNKLKEEICILLLKIQQLEAECGNKLIADKNVESEPLNSFLCDASSIHNVDCSLSLMQEQQSSIGDFLKNFQGTTTDKLLLTHVYELQLFLRKLMMNESTCDLSQDFTTSVNIQHIKKLLLDIDRTLDASQCGTSFLLLEKTFKSLPASMENIEASQIVKSDPESDGTSKDRDMSVMSSHSYTRDLGVPVENDDVKDYSNFKENTLSKGTKVKQIPTSNTRELETLVRRIEIAVENILREFSKYNNENPSLVLQLLDTLKEPNGNQQSNLLKGQILTTFEILGEKMDSLSTRTKEVYSAISALNTHLSLFDASKTDFQNSSTAKQLSTLNITSASNEPNLESQNFVPMEQRVSEDQVLQEHETNLLHELSSDIHSVNVETAKDKYNLEVLRDFNNQLVESLRSSLDWVKSINDAELSDIIEKQGVENILNIGGHVNREISPTIYSEEVTRLSAMLPNWVRLNRMLYQITAKSLRDKKQALKASEEQVVNLKNNLELKFKDLKQVQDWNLRLQNELDCEKATLSSTQDRLASIQEAFQVASNEVKSKTEENAKIWEENKMLKWSIESNSSDSGAIKQLCNKQKEQLLEFKLQKENVEFQLEKLKGEFDSWITKTDDDLKLKNEYVNQIQILKEEVEHLLNSRNGIEQEKNELLSSIAHLRKEVEKHKEAETSWVASYKALETELDECKTKLETLLASKERGLLSKNGVGSDLQEAHSNNADLEENCKLLGERLNEVQKRNRELTSQLKSAKEKLKKLAGKDADKDVAIDLKELEKQLNDAIKTKDEIETKLQAETKARIEVEKLAVSESRAKAEAERKLLSLQDANNENTNSYYNEKLLLETKVHELLFEVENLKLKLKDMESLTDELNKEKERSARYKRNYSAAKNSLKGKNQEVKVVDKSNRTIDDNVAEPWKNSFDLNASNNSKSTTECSQQNEMEFTPERHNGEKRDIQNLESFNIMDLLFQINLLKSELDKTKLANEQLTNEIIKYEAHYKKKSKQVDSISTEGFLQSYNSPIELEYGHLSRNQTEVKKQAFVALKTGTVVEHDMISSSESLLHSRVVEQLGGPLSSRSRLTSDFSCIHNEVPVRDIDTDPAFCVGKVPPDFQSSNEEIQTIIAATGNLKTAGTYPVSAYSSPDLGIESDPNRDRDWSRSPLNVSSEGVTSKKQVDKSSVDNGNVLLNTSTLTVLGRLSDLVLLNKEIEESSAILHGIKARIIDRIKFLSEKYSSTSPAKNLEYSTLKELDSSCFKLQVCLDRSTTLISAFWIDKSQENSHSKALLLKDKQDDKSLVQNVTDAEKLELYRLRKEFEDQSKKLKDALSELAGFQRRKEKVDKAISKQLTKTKKVLRKAKGNLLDEQKATATKEGTNADKNTVDEMAVHNANDNIFPKHVSSTPMVKTLK